jgi:universal stress protein E
METDMKELKSILVVLDRSDRDPRVVARALALQKHFGARLELFLCDAEHEYAFRHNFDDRGNAEGRRTCVADATAYLSSLGDAFPTDPASVNVDACCESPWYEGVLGKIRQMNPDLVLKSPDCARRDCRLAFSDNDWQLASTCPAPLMFVGTRAWSSTPRLVAAVDASASERPGLARAILDVAELIRAGVDGQLEVVTCTAQADREDDSRTNGRRLEELVSDLPIGKERIHRLSGQPEAVLPRFAAGRNCDILIMGALAHRPGLAPVVGSLTGKLVGALDCDFILIKTAPLTVSDSAFAA